MYKTGQYTMPKMIQMPITLWNCAVQYLVGYRNIDTLNVSHIINLYNEIVFNITNLLHSEI